MKTACWSFSVPVLCALSIALWTQCPLARFSVWHNLYPLWFLQSVVQSADGEGLSSWKCSALCYSLVHRLIFYSDLHGWSKITLKLMFLSNSFIKWIFSAWRLLTFRNSLSKASTNTWPQLSAGSGKSSKTSSSLTLLLVGLRAYRVSLLQVIFYHKLAAV